MTQPMPKKCPVCKKPAIEKYRPFCSSRCADIDLGKWLGERYRVETDDKPSENGANAEEDENDNG
jgi:uncharacterized protein